MPKAHTENKKLWVAFGKTYVGKKSLIYDITILNKAKAYTNILI